MNTTKQETRSAARALRPRTDVLETADALVLVADLAGVDDSSVELSLTDDVLTVRARAGAPAPEGWRTVWSEFTLGDYERRFRLSADIDGDAIAATIQQGRLQVTLPKRRPRSNRIEVKST
jgi:HSP20 family protein